MSLSPFVTVGGISGNWTSLIIALVPRILLGAISGWLYELFAKKINRPLSALLAAVIATFCHTLMVLGLIALLWGNQYSAAIGIAPSALLAYLGMVIVSNSLMEMATAGIVSMALAKAISPSRMSSPASSHA